MFLIYLFFLDHTLALKCIYVGWLLRLWSQIMRGPISKYDPKFFPKMWSSVQLMHPKLHIQLDIRCRNTMKQKSTWILTQNFPPKCGAVCGSCIQITHSIRFLAKEQNEAKIYMDFDPKIFPKMWSSVQLMHPKLHIQLDFRCRNTMEHKSIWILTQNFSPKCGAVCSSCI